ncbi:ATP-binding cassette, subfamily F, uup [Desulfuromusa kysingii]|uniref:ATP-binding protein Uup n=1 Tax=Desulfuromusa kysingii TaxID=37625 RepID=A0A1H4CNE1_9BACT|nr:ATP-binding cassette domain-containing protein [Desulfuromusa kysingii]SEA61981.1 ATP-binding cassette, subfamily F, uup [Desulfuromusa kysingii]
MNIISLNQVSHAFGGPKLLDAVSLHIEAGDRICLLGRNGAGKSTLLHLINGDYPADSGEIIRNQKIQSAYVPQEFPDHLTGELQHHLQHVLSQQGMEPHQADVQIEQTLTQLEMHPQTKLETMSGGQKRRALLATALVQNPDLILLDEPTNHLDINAISWLENFLLRLRKTLIFISHDRTFARNLANRIIELDRGQLQDYRCDYATFLQRRQEVLNSEEQAWARFDQKLAEEEIWIRKGIKARRSRNMGRVRDLLKLREERRQRRDRTGQVKLQLETGQRSGQMVLETENLSFKYGDETIIAHLNLRIMRGDRIGLIGPNGSGKTTLLKLLTEVLQPSQGQLRLGTNLQIAYFDQLRQQLDEDRTVKQNIADDHDQVIINGNPRHIYGYLQDFLFTPERARTPVRVLSGGEKNRLLLAKLFTQPANLLILDEPTNDLDMETLDLLEELLLDYKGTVLLVSHDRSFLNNVVTSSLVFSGNGVIDEVIGGYDDWLATQPKTETAPKKEKAKPAQRKQRARKLSFKEKKELTELPEQIDALETEQADIHEKLADPEIYKDGDGSQISNLQQRLQNLEIELEKAYQRWEELDKIPE